MGQLAPSQSRSRTRQGGAGYPGHENKGRPGRLCLRLQVPSMKGEKARAQETQRLAGGQEKRQRLSWNWQKIFLGEGEEAASLKPQGEA